MHPVQGSAWDRYHVCMPQLSHVAGILSYLCFTTQYASILSCNISRRLYKNNLHHSCYVCMVPMDRLIVNITATIFSFVTPRMIRLGLQVRLGLRVCLLFISYFPRDLAEGTHHHTFKRQSARTYHQDLASFKIAVRDQLESVAVCPLSQTRARELARSFPCQRTYPAPITRVVRLQALRETQYKVWY